MDKKLQAATDVDQDAVPSHRLRRAKISAKLARLELDMGKISEIEEEEENESQPSSKVSQRNSKRLNGKSEELSDI
eukprot:CAMPEP_0170472216 /NCGR_PEP_ID=MMETSP0123-20130129/14285_1 /TAXON_ID=182087 /ORGANISM="Favella ehrenbergii, Strain Fehren 1" /LENGTH=75 /DNA_ID=CAMNT_0010740341 /DNA_START=58 /DNA_END=285 /DNA_ORIENTATION=-